MFIDETENVFCLWRAEFSPSENACFYGIDIFSRQDSVWLREKEEHVEYAYHTDELEKLLGKAGFEDINIYGELNMQPPRQDENRVFITAKKPK